MGSGKSHEKSFTVHESVGWLARWTASVPATARMPGNTTPAEVPEIVVGTRLSTPGGPHGEAGGPLCGMDTRQWKSLSSSLVQVGPKALDGIGVDWVLAATMPAMNTPSGPPSQPRM